MEKGDKVKLPVHPTMTVEQIKYDENTGAKSLLCSWMREDGEKVHRWFKDGEVEAA